MIIVSVMFTLYMLPIAQYFTSSLTGLIYFSLPLFAESVFLCFFFKETRTLLCPVAFAATIMLLQELTPLVPTTVEYTTLISLICYAFLVPIMQEFMAEVKGQNAKFEVVVEPEPDESMDVERHDSSNVLNDKPGKDEPTRF